MIGAVIGALVIGLISVFAIVISEGIILGQSTSGWPTVLTSITTNIAPVIGIVGIKAIVPLKSNLHRITSRIRWNLNPQGHGNTELNRRLNPANCVETMGFASLLG